MTTAPDGFSAQIIRNGLGQELWRELICNACGCLVPDDSQFVRIHRGACRK